MLKRFIVHKHRSILTIDIPFSKNILSGLTREGGTV
jgi:hypothetical protein